MDSKKKCPMCAEEVPANATVCPYCNTPLTSQTPPDAVPAPPQTTQPARKPKPTGLVIGISIAAGLVILCILAGIIWAVSRGGIMGLLPVASATATPTATATRKPSSTLQPTTTATPLPAWVTDFAQPILDAIAYQPPTFQDDFGLASAGWYSQDWCGRRLEYLEGELVITSCTGERPGLDFPDFVVELDGRFLPDTSDHGIWLIAFRDSSCPHCGFGVAYDGAVAITFTGDDDLWVADAALSGYQTNHIMLIAKEGKFAFFVNYQPLYYTEKPPLRWGGISLEVGEYGEPTAGEKGIVAFDNLKIWNISSLP